MRPVLKVLYAPLILLAYNGAAVWLVASKAAWFWLLPLLLAAIATSFAVERIIPYEPVWNCDRGDAARDLIYAIAYEASVYLSVALIPLPRSIGDDRLRGKVAVDGPIANVASPHGPAIAESKSAVPCRKELLGCPPHRSNITSCPPKPHRFGQYKPVGRPQA